MSAFKQKVHLAGFPPVPVWFVALLVIATSATMMVLVLEGKKGVDQFARMERCQAEHTFEECAKMREEGLL